MSKKCESRGIPHIAVCASVLAMNRVPTVRVEQNDDRGYVRLNALGSWDTDFVKFPSSCDSKICNANVFISGDPRLKHMAHADGTLALDTVPRNGKVQIPEDLSNEGCNVYHNSYSDIRNGDFSYYYSKDLKVPFISTLFSQPSLVVRSEYIDPMGTLKPHFCRMPLTLRPASEGMSNKNGLSWIRDSQFHREDLMARQLWSRNQNNYAVVKT